MERHAEGKEEALEGNGGEEGGKWSERELAEDGERKVEEQISVELQEERGKESEKG